KISIPYPHFAHNPKPSHSSRFSSPFSISSLLTEPWQRDQQREAVVDSAEASAGAEATAAAEEADAAPGAAREEEKWVPVTKLGRLVKEGKIKSLEQIYLHSLPIKEHQIIDALVASGSLKDEVMKIMPVQKQTRAGQRTRFKAFVVVGDSNGHVGLGVKCSKEVATAIRGAIILAKLSVIPVRRGYWGNKIGKPHTVPCKVTGKCGSVTVRMVPAPRGAGIVAARVPKKVLQFAGIDDVFTSSRGSTKTLGNFVKATFDCLLKTYGFLTPEFWKETRFSKSPFQEFTDLLGRPTKPLLIEDVEKRFTNAYIPFGCSIKGTTMAERPAERGRGGFGRGFGGRGGDRGRGGGRRRPGRREEEEKWVPVTKLGRLVKEGKIKSLEQIYLHSLPIKEHQIIDALVASGSLKDEVMKIMPVQKQTRAGQRTRFKAFVVVGDSNGHVGLGVKCSKEVATAIRGAIILAKLSVIPVRRGYWGNKIGKPHTVPCKVTGKCGSVTVRMVPAPRGAGIVAARVPKKVLQFAGIDDVFTSSRGSTKTLGNFVKATFDCLLKTYGFLTPEFWKETRFSKSPFQEFTDLLGRPTKPLLIEDVEKELKYDYII
ncbi:Ribosomal protein S5 family protein, partial [Prunus dulcis]